MPGNLLLIFVPMQSSQSDSRVMNGVTLPMLLITPVQRIPRYILLLKVILFFFQLTVVFFL